MIWDNWQYETSAIILPQKRFEGTAEYVRKKKIYILRVTATKTKEVVEKISIAAVPTFKSKALEADVAITQAKQLAREYDQYRYEYQIGKLGENKKLLAN